MRPPLRILHVMTVAVVATTAGCSGDGKTPVPGDEAAGPAR